MIKFTKEDYENHTNETLDTAVPSKDNPSSKVPRFINRVVDFIYEYVGTYGQFPIPEDDKLTDFQKTMIKRAGVVQAEYILDNGLINNLSGYDEDKGVTLTREYQADIISIAPSAYNSLYRCGLLNRNIKDHGGSYRDPFTRRIW